MAVNPTIHLLVPKHTKLTSSQKEKLLNKFNISPKQLPRILKNDPAIAKLGASIGDIIQIERESKTAGVSAYYRVVAED